MLKTNYHTHTTFCDGTEQPEKMVLAAIERNIDVLGFSAHAIYPFESDWHLKVCDYDSYVAEIRSLQKKYESQIKILLGFEVEYIPEVSAPNKSVYKNFSPDYLIGSVHYVDKNGSAQDSSQLIFETPKDEGCKYVSHSRFAVDGPVEALAEGLEKVFGGDEKKLVSRYFALQREMVSSCDFDIVAHPDVIRKRNGVLHFFDENASWYKAEVEATAKAFASSGKIVEINTGGMARDAIDDTYPSDYFLRLLKKYDVPVVIVSDAHASNQLDFAFDYAQKKAHDAGYTRLAIL